MNALLSRFVNFICFFFAYAPRRLQLFWGDVIAFLWFDVFRIRRDVALNNLKIAFPEWSEEKRIHTARESLRNMGRGLLEFTIFPFFDQRTVDTYFMTEGLNHLESALAEGKGVMILTLHLGNGDFAVAALSRMGYRMNLISKIFKNKTLNAIWFGMRERHGTKFIAPEKSSFEILRALKRKEIVVFVLDQFMGPPVGVRTKFFGKETGTAAGLALMAGRTGAPVVPSYTCRLPDGKHIIYFDAPIPYESASETSPLVGNTDESLRVKNIARMTQVYTDRLEAIIRRFPEQWMWIHRRWKDFRD